MLSLVAVTALSGCFSTDQGTYDQVVEFWKHQNYYQAYHEIERVRAANPDDDSADELYELVRHDYLLWQARSAIFGNDEPKALGFLEQVLTRNPEDPIALGLQTKARQKIAAEKVRAARLLAVTEIDRDLAEAYELFTEALQADPGNIEAQNGVRDVEAVWAKRRESAEDRRLRGIRNLADGFPQRAAYEFSIALSEDPRMDSIENANAQAQRAIAERNYEFGQSAEEDKHWDSAERIYRSLLETHPDLPGLAERLAYVRREAEARRLFQQAEVAIFQTKFEKARELLDRAAELSTEQRADIAISHLLVTEREAEIRAALARDQELQGNLQRALDIYLEIRGDVPEEVDVEGKIEDLQIRISEAVAAYDAGRKAEAVGDTETAVSQYGAVELFWPGFQDAAERRAALLTPEAGAEGEGGDAGPEPAGRPDPVRIEPAPDGPATQRARSNPTEPGPSGPDGSQTPSGSGSSESGPTAPERSETPGGAGGNEPGPTGPGGSGH